MPSRIHFQWTVTRPNQDKMKRLKSKLPQKFHHLIPKRGSTEEQGEYIDQIGDGFWETILLTKYIMGDEFLVNVSAIAHAMDDSDDPKDWNLEANDLGASDALPFVEKKVGHLLELRLKPVEDYNYWKIGKHFGVLLEVIVNPEEKEILAARRAKFVKKK